MTDRKRPLATEHMIARGRQLRQDMTFPERLLWSRLRDCRLAGLRFRRQHPVWPYVADYFCPSAKVVVELDGRSHNGQGDQDRQRQDYLEQQGLRVIRFTAICGIRTGEKSREGADLHKWLVLKALHQILMTPTALLTARE